MPVKDLIGLYELRSPPSSPSSISVAQPDSLDLGASGRLRGHTKRSLVSLHDSRPLTLTARANDPPKPSPARFIQHARMAPSPMGHPNDNPIMNYDFTNHDNPITKSFQSSQPLSQDTVKGNSPHFLPSTPEELDISHEPADGMEKGKATPSETTHASDRESAQSPPTKFSRFIGAEAISTGRDFISAASTSTLMSPPQDEKKFPKNHPTRNLPPHKPIPAVEVFARNAPPLHLPALDDYLSSIQPMPVSLPSPPSTGSHKDPTARMFPPMNRLAATGKSLRDLETNAAILPPWRNRNSILGVLVNTALGATGSSALATFYSLQGVFDTVQVFALVLSTVAPRSDLKDKWKALFLGTIPNVLALNFASTLVQSLLFLLVFMVISAILLYSFFVITNRCKAPNSLEGLQAKEQQKTGWGLIVISFILTLLYLPLSTIAVHALVWSEDFWVVKNPYSNSTTYPPTAQILDPSSEFRDPLEFCYTTTMKRNEVNFAPAVVVASAVIFVLMTVWFPLRLRKVVMEAVPIADRYTELGVPRTKSDLDREYQRLLDRDRNPVSFLYLDFRRGWASYRSLYLFAKLTTLLLVAVIDPNNCWFLSFPRLQVSVARQALLVLSMLVFFLLQCFLAPFVDPVNNASELTSRLNYLLTAAVGLGVALDLPGQRVLNGPILYAIYIITYGLSLYFTFINFSWMHRIVKRVTRRVDFSIDVFSPHLDISPTSPHVKRRIWQEAISTIFLTSPECKIPENQRMVFAQASNGTYPPYLLDYKGSPAERHVENIKILREVGTVAFMQGVAAVCSGDRRRLELLQDQILDHFIGPDCYWKDPNRPASPGSSKHFGNAWWIPFPPTLVLRYDAGPLVVLKELRDLQLYVDQNQSQEISRKREIRMALRALDGRIITWPYEHQQAVGARANLCCCGGRQYKALSLVRFRTCALRIKQRGDLAWQNINLGSGFDVEMTYAENVQVDGSVIGLTDDYELNTSLARFLALNEKAILAYLPKIQGTIHAYRHELKGDCHAKAKVLSYPFMMYAYDQPQDPRFLAERVIETEKDLRVRQLVANSQVALEVSYNRHVAVTSQPVASWWYIFWDDLWRRNWDTISALQVHAQDFNPHYPTSIAYTPLPRPALEAFLTQRGLLLKARKSMECFHSGFLNKVYLRLNDIVFHDSDKAILFHLGNGVNEIDLEDVDLATQARPSTLGTGGGTDHDDVSIRARPNYRWEGILDDPLSRCHRYERGWMGKLGVWFGLTPLWKTGTPSKGLSLDVKLHNGRYVLIGGDERTLVKGSAYEKADVERT